MDFEHVSECIEEQEVKKIGKFTFAKVVSGSQDDFLYNLKSSSSIKCFGCSHYIRKTSHTCRTKYIFKPNQWIRKKDNTHQKVRRENFKNMLEHMVDSGLLVLSDRVKNHLLENIFTFCPAEESHQLESGDRFQLPSDVSDQY